MKNATSTESYSLDGELSRELVLPLGQDQYLLVRARWHADLTESPDVDLTLNGSFLYERDGKLPLAAMREALGELLDRIDKSNPSYNEYVSFRLEVMSDRMLML